MSFFVVSVQNALKIWSATGYIGLYMMVATQIGIKLITSTKWHQKLNNEYKIVVAERRKKKKKA